MGIISLLFTIEVADVQDFAFACRIRLQQFVDPGIIACSVDNDVLGVGNRSRIGGRRLIIVGVSIGIINDASHMYVTSTDLRGDTPPKIFSRNNLNSPRTP